jgi:hypothetical protein
MAPNNATGSRHHVPEDAGLFETVSLGEQLLDRAKSVSQEITEACRRLAPDITSPDTPTLQRDTEQPNT